jgi:hypothetical protein
MTSTVQGSHRLEARMAGVGFFSTGSTHRTRAKARPDRFLRSRRAPAKKAVPDF